MSQTSNRLGSEPGYHAAAAHPVAGQPPNQSAPMTPWFVPSILVLFWAVMALPGGLVVVLYLGAGVIMTATLDGVFGASSTGATFNWALLIMALAGQLLGLVFAVVTALSALAHRKRGRRLATAATVLGFVAVGVFVIVGLIQVPLIPILLDALSM